MTNFKDTLKSMRKRRDYTQVELAEMSGLTSQIISNFEREYTEPNQRQLAALAKALNCKVSDLIEIDDLDVDYEKIMFSDKKSFDALPKEEKQRILQNLQEQADFMVERAKTTNA
ncbi:helix-turn-helix domain-containing protein [Staphylococcus sp. LKG3-3]|uniref:helix-turn-helix domain-containing protein n=1 Tax=Staphylococcus sp. LKG3-3 TaxID=3399685 RepID=UPI003D545B04